MDGRHETEHKSFQAPDETREFPHGHAEILKVGGGEVESPADAGQSDVDDSGVENNHELPEADEDEDQPGRGGAHRAQGGGGGCQHAGLR